jgi:hypothetical protein
MIGINVLSICENMDGALCSCKLLQVDQTAREALGLMQLCKERVTIPHELE